MFIYRGESALLLRFWKYLDVSSDKVAEEYYKELALMEEQGIILLNVLLILLIIQLQMINLHYSI